MNGSEPNSAVRPVRFGIFEIDLAAAELRRDGRLIKLQDQPYRLLVYLLQRPGILVTREELRAALWPDGSYVDFEQGLNTTIRKVRQALGDTAENPRFIQTLPRKGYKFIAPVGAPEGSPTQASTPPPRRRGWIAGLAVSAALVAAVWIYYSRQSRPVAGIPQPLISNSGMQDAIAYSPDGRRIAFSWNGPQQTNFDIYVKTLGTDSLTRITSDGALSPAWSPDGQRIAFLRDIGNGKLGVFIAPASGGAAVQVAEVPAPSTLDMLALQFRNLAFTPDGNWLITAAGKTGEGGPPHAGLVLCPTISGACRPLTEPSDGYDMHPAISPDGRTLAFLRGPLLASLDLHVVPLDTNWRPVGQPRRLTAWNRFSLSPAWTSNGKDILLASGEFFHTRLWRVPVETPAAASVIAAVGEGAWLPAVAPNGDLAYSHRYKRVNIWSLDLGRPSSSLVKWLASSNRIDTHPRFSPDGKQVAFKSTRTGTDQIWVARADGSDARQLTSMPSTFLDMPCWSPDGKTIVFRTLHEGRFEFYRIAASGGKPHLLMQGVTGDGPPNLSHDGRWLYFHSKRSGQYQIWRMPAEGGEAVQLTHGGGSGVRESRDGTALYFVRYGEAERASLWTIPAGGGTENKVLDSVLGESFDVGSNGIYYVGGCQPDGFCPILFHSFSTGKSVMVAASGRSGNNGLSLAPDERTLLRGQVNETGSEIMVIPGFQ